MQGNHLETDSDIIEGCILGNPRMQKMLYDKYSPKMYSVCLRYAANEEDAKDILQDGFIKVFTNISKFKSLGSFEGWIRRIIVNTAIEQFRKKNKLYSLSDATTEDKIESDDAPIFNQLETKELLNLIKSLPSGYRSVFNLYAIEGYTHKEIAALMDISEGTSKSQYSRAKALLQDKIKNHNHQK